jgi:hypothetical protein
MDANESSMEPGQRKPPASGVIKVLFVLILFVALLLLGRSMVRHRFFQGGREHRNGSIGQ